MKTYEPVIGIEIHSQVSTQTKLFCGCSTDSFNATPNTNVCPICMGFPGMLPVLNEEVLRKGVIAGLVLKCEIPAFSKFDRKNYFYPDLPKGFQISQYDKPVAINGSIEIMVSGAPTRIRINRLHLEDDAGKLVHAADSTLCDYNRSGTPLMEIVSEPDIRSVAEAKAYVEEMRRVLRYSGSSECDMEKGMMRFDINVSLREVGVEKFGTKVEVKNLNSFRALERALQYEIERQTQTLEEGGEIAQETRGWDDKAAQTVSQRSKEQAHDYRYFPEPDLPPVVLEKELVARWATAVPELPLVRKARFVKDLGLSDEDAGILTEEKAMADYFEEVAAVSGDVKKSSSFINTILLKHLHEDQLSIGECKISAAQLGRLIALINKGAISNNIAKTEVFGLMYRSGEDPEKIIEEKGLKVMSNSGELEEVCKKVVQDNGQSVADYKAGKTAALGFLVGQVMKQTKGQANPVMVHEILKKLLA